MMVVIVVVVVCCLDELSLFSEGMFVSGFQ